MRPRRQAEARHADGFTLVEMLAVMAIVALLASIAIPAVRPPPDRVRLEGAARTVAAALRLSRARAISTNDEVAFTLDVDTRSFRIADAVSKLDPHIAVAMIVGVARRETGADGSILFFPDGTSSGGDLTLTLGTARVRLSVHWLTGLARMEFEGVVVP